MSVNTDKTWIYMHECNKNYQNREWFVSIVETLKAVSLKSLESRAFYKRKTEIMKSRRIERI